MKISQCINCKHKDKCCIENRIKGICNKFEALPMFIGGRKRK